jgi:uncharacterized protein
MTDPQPQLPVRREMSPLLVTFVVLMVTIFSFPLATVLGTGLALAFYDGTINEFMVDLAEPTGKENMKGLLMLIQGVTTIVGLAIVPTFFWWSMRRRSVAGFFNKTKMRPVYFLIIPGIVLSFAVLNSVFIEWNSHVSFGELDKFLRSLEEKAMEATKFLTSFSNFGQYLVGVLVIAVFAAISEEMVFRGLLQTEFQKAVKNHHVAIWTAAFFFSLLHMQFYGFIPRLLLGGLFGYLYYWSGNLMVPMLAHFVNNFFAVSMIYFGMTDLPGMEVDEPTTPPWYVVVIGTAICGALIYYFRSILPKPAPDDVTA